MLQRGFIFYEGSLRGSRIFSLPRWTQRDFAFEIALANPYFGIANHSIRSRCRRMAFLGGTRVQNQTGLPCRRRFDWALFGTWSRTARLCTIAKAEADEKNVKWEISNNMSPRNQDTTPPPAPTEIDGRSLTIFDVVHTARDRRPVRLTENAWAQVEQGRLHVEEVLRKGGTAYGVNTGVGSQRHQILERSEIATFNQRLLVAHATVASEVVIDETTLRAALVCLINSLASGLSGVRPQVLRALLDALSADDLPSASAGASVGASDLVPLAQMALRIFGIGDPFGPVDHAKEGMPLEAKEALAVMNSNAVSLGHGAITLLATRKLLRGFDLSFALAIEGFRGNVSILHPAVLHAHPQHGQAISTKHLRRLLRNGLLLEGTSPPRNLQDPLSFRCAPQVHGAAYATLEWVWQNWETELNSVTDNPVVDRKGETLISHGNMDTSLLSIGMDSLRAALANAVSLSAHRLHKLHWPEFSGLPSGLTDTPTALGGVQFLNLSHIGEAYAAAARARAHPMLFTYQGQLADGVEDHAAMLPLSTTETERLIDLAWTVQALELTVAAWAVRRRGVDAADLGEGLQSIYARLEPQLPVGREGSSVFDLRPIVQMVRDEQLVDLIDEEAPPIPRFEPAPIESVVKMPEAPHGQ